jgi:hypothetical protein
MYRGKLTQCPNCGYLMPDSGKPCPRCQEPEDVGSVRLDRSPKRGGRWKPWAVVAAIPVVIFGSAGIWQEHDNTLYHALVLPARHGACGNLSGGVDPEQANQSSCAQFAQSSFYTIKQDSRTHAFVTFRRKGTLDSLQVMMSRDSAGDWHVVSAKEGINDD